MTPGKKIEKDLIECFKYSGVSKDARIVEDKLKFVSYQTLLNHAKGLFVITPESHKGLIELMKLAIVRFEQNAKTKEVFKKLIK